MRRRVFLAATSVAALSPAVVRAQPKAMPVVGFLALASADEPSGPVAGILLALRQAGLEVGQAVRMEYRYANYQLDRLPALAAELVQFPVSVIITAGGPGPALAAKAATKNIPIVFAPTSDPVRTGLVSSLNRPGGNMTGIAALTVELDPKRLELLHDLAPGRSPLGVLLNSTRPDTQTQLEVIKGAAQSVGRDLVPAYASSRPEIDAAFAVLASRSIGGLLVAADPFFTSQRTQIVVSVARYGWPATYQWREFVDAGGLASYGPSLFEMYHQVGLYVVRILKGEKPAELPVLQPTKFELVVSTKAAKAIGLTIPPSILARADEVIE